MVGQRWDAVIPCRLHHSRPGGSREVAQSRFAAIRLDGLEGLGSGRSARAIQTVEASLRAGAQPVGVFRRGLRGSGNYRTDGREPAGAGGPGARCSPARTPRDCCSRKNAGRRDCASPSTKRSGILPPIRIHTTRPDARWRGGCLSIPTIPMMASFVLPMRVPIVFTNVRSPDVEEFG